MESLFRRYYHSHNFKILTGDNPKITGKIASIGAIENNSKRRQASDIFYGKSFR
jgi:hypothetical protein